MQQYSASRPSPVDILNGGEAEQIGAILLATTIGALSGPDLQPERIAKTSNDVLRCSEHVIGRYDQHADQADTSRSFDE